MKRWSPLTTERLSKCAAASHTATALQDGPADDWLHYGYADSAAVAAVATAPPPPLQSIREDADCWPTGHSAADRHPAVAGGVVVQIIVLICAPLREREHRPPWVPSDRHSFVRPFVHSFIHSFVPLTDETAEVYCRATWIRHRLWAEVGWAIGLRLARMMSATPGA